MDPSELRACMRASLAEGLKALEGFLGQEDNISAMASMSAALSACFSAGNKVLACGNGGSACDALHFAEEFTGRFRKERRPLPVIPLMESGHLTCVANDYGWDEVFARGVEAYGKPGDILVLLSTSGNSPNVVKAAAAARRAGVKILLLLGRDGGALKGQGDLEIIVPGRNSDRIQEIHMQVLHILIEGVEREMFPGNYAAEASGVEPPAAERPNGDGQPATDERSQTEVHPQDWAPRTAPERASRRLSQ